MTEIGTTPADIDTAIRHVSACQSALTIAMARVSDAHEAEAQAKTDLATAEDHYRNLQLHHERVVLHGATVSYCPACGSVPCACGGTG